MDSVTEKEVYYHLYCETCKHKELSEHTYPCLECLENPLNIDSHKPTKYEAKQTKRK